MRNTFFYLIFCCLFTPVLLAQNIHLPSPDNAQNRVDMLHLELNIRVDWAQKSVAGVANITFVALQEISELYLDAAQLNIREVKVQGRSVPFQYDRAAHQGALKIMLGKKHPQGWMGVVSVHYASTYFQEIDPLNLSGSVGKGLRFSLPSTNDPLKPKEVYSMGEINGNRYWYPSVDNLHDWFTSQLNITVEKGLLVVANGVRTALKPNKDGTQTYSFSDETPHPNYLNALAAGPYSDYTQTVSGVNLHSLGYSGEQADVIASTVRLTDMFRFYAQYLDMTYPYKDYTQVFVQDLPNWQGNHTFSTITENMVDDAPTHADFYYLWDITEGEALASQWVGAQTHSAEWSEIWLNKALPHYLYMLYSMQKNGRDEMLSYQWSFDQWLFSAGHPEFLVSQQWNTFTQEMIIRVEQNVKTATVAQYPAPDFFRGKIKISLENEIHTVEILPQRTNEYRFKCASEPAFVRFDVGGNWIKSLIFEKTVPALLAQMEHDADILGRYEALNALATKWKTGALDSLEQQQVLSSMQRVLAGEVYWRFKNAVLSQLRQLLPRNNGCIVPGADLEKCVLSLVQNEASWLKASAITLLGETRKTAYLRIYLNQLDDKSDRVINAAAVAAAKTKHPEVFGALERLVHKPSMKSQSLLSALAGLAELGDERGAQIAFEALLDTQLPRWRLPDGSVWDYRVFAARNLANTDRAPETTAVLGARLQHSIDENDINGIFNNLLLIAILGEQSGKIAFEQARKYFENQPAYLEAVLFYETQFNTK